MCLGDRDRVTDRRQMKEELVTILRMLLGMPAAVRGDLPAPGLSSDGASAVHPPPAATR